MHSTRDDAHGREADWPQGVTLLSQQVLPTMGSLLLVPVLPLILSEYGAMPGAAYWVPTLLTAPALCIALFSIFAGILGDRIGRKKPLIAALTLYGVAGMAPLFLTNFTSILASRFMLGICEALITTLSMTMLGDYFSGARRDRWLALITTVGAGSGVAFFALSGVLGAKFGWRAPTAVYGFALLLIPAMLAFTWEPGRHRAEPDAGDTPFPWPHILAVGIVTLMGAVFFWIVAIQQAFGLVALGADAGRIGMLTAISGFGAPLGSLVFRRFVEVATSRLLAIEMLLIGGGLLGMSQSHSDVTFSVVAFFALIGAGMLMPTLVTWMARGLPFAVRGRGMGIFQSIFSFGQFASGLILPFIARNVVNGVLPAFSLLGVIGLVGATIAFFLATKGGQARLQMT